jgi:alpha-tubulin suppressor-like RCC1 family protein
VPYKVGTGFTQISGGYSYAAAIKSDGSLWAWGTLKSWEVSSAADVVTTPTKIGSGFVKVVATFDQAYAIASDGSFWGWGRNVDLGFVSAPIDFASSPIKLN